MKFNSFKSDFLAFLPKIIECPLKHARWLNTLSYLENCGARKIANCEHPTLVREEILKHAAEEFRHAYYLKRQIRKLSTDILDTYHSSYLLGGINSLHYLHALDIGVSRYLVEERNLTGSSLKEHAYYLVTYAIELRASELYSLYAQLLKEKGSKISVSSIMLEEEGHLAEMERQLDRLSRDAIDRERACKLESILCMNWLAALKKEC